MEAFTTHRGVVATLDRANVDTDQIIPKQFLKSIKRTGFGPALFFDWRYLDDGTTPNPDFVLNHPRYEGANILLARHNFGCGSSREHAVWALEVNNINVVIAESFARIFRQNMFNCGILAIELSADDIEQIFNLQGDVQIDVDLEKEIVTATETGGEKRSIESPFSMNHFDSKLVQAGGWLAFADQNY